MKFKLSGNTLTVIRETGDPKFYCGSWGNAESRFLYHVKQALNKSKRDIEKIGNGHSIPRIKFIKKRMWKDGNMVDESQQYLRTKTYVGKQSCLVKPITNPLVFEDENVYFILYNNHWAISDLGEDFNQGEAQLSLGFIPICKPQLNKNDPDRMDAHFKEAWEHCND